MKKLMNILCVKIQRIRWVVLLLMNGAGLWEGKEG